MNIPLDWSPAGRVAIVTGGSRGVGRATIRLLAARGYAVVINYLHDRRAAESIVEAILAGSRDAVAIRADVADDLDVERMFAETIAAFGGIDVVVHALGSPVIATPVAEFDLDVLDALVRINTRATFIVNREAARHLRNGGAIVNLTGSADGSSLPATASTQRPKPPQTCSPERSHSSSVSATSPSTRSHSRSICRAHPTGSPTSSRTCSPTVATTLLATCSGSTIRDMRRHRPDLPSVRGIRCGRRGRARVGHGSAALARTGWPSGP